MSMPTIHHEAPSRLRPTSHRPSLQSGSPGQAGALHTVQPGRQVLRRGLISGTGASLKGWTGSPPRSLPATNGRTVMNLQGLSAQLTGLAGHPGCASRYRQPSSAGDASMPCSSSSTRLADPAIIGQQTDDPASRGPAVSRTLRDELVRANQSTASRKRRWPIEGRPVPGFCGGSKGKSRFHITSVSRARIVTPPRCGQISTSPALATRTSCLVVVRRHWRM
jgi:hypothetical protein